VAAGKLLCQSREGKERASGEGGGPPVKKKKWRGGGGGGTRPTAGPGHGGGESHGVGGNRGADTKIGEGRR
jgi:hypothetical protein